MSRKILKGNFTTGTQNIEAVLPVITYKEDSVFIMCCPALDIVGCGNTEKEAHQSFDITLLEFFDYTLKKRTLHDELVRIRQ